MIIYIIYMSFMSDFNNKMLFTSFQQIWSCRNRTSVFKSHSSLLKPGVDLKTPRLSRELHHGGFIMQSSLRDRSILSVHLLCFIHSFEGYL